MIEFIYDNKEKIYKSYRESITIKNKIDSLKKDLYDKSISLLENDSYNVVEFLIYVDGDNVALLIKMIEENSALLYKKSIFFNSVDSDNMMFGFKRFGEYLNTNFQIDPHQYCVDLNVLIKNDEIHSLIRDLMNLDNLYFDSVFKLEDLVGNDREINKALLCKELENVLLDGNILYIYNIFNFTSLDREISYTIFFMEDGKIYTKSIKMNKSNMNDIIMIEYNILDDVSNHLDVSYINGYDDIKTFMNLFRNIMVIRYVNLNNFNF